MIIRPVSTWVRARSDQCNHNAHCLFRRRSNLFAWYLKTESTTRSPIRLVVDKNKLPWKKLFTFSTLGSAFSLRWKHQGGICFKNNRSLRARALVEAMIAVLKMKFWRFYTGVTWVLWFNTHPTWKSNASPLPIPINCLPCPRQEIVWKQLFVCYCYTSSFYHGFSRDRFLDQ